MNDDMKIALSFWRGRIAPVFDVSEKVVLVELQSNRAIRRREVVLVRSGPSGCLDQLRHLGVDLVICGAISRWLEKTLNQAGIRVVGFVCGDIEAIIDAVENGRVSDACFRMPGCALPVELAPVEKKGIKNTGADRFSAAPRNKKRRPRFNPIMPPRGASLKSSKPN